MQWSVEELRRSPLWLIVVRSSINSGADKHLISKKKKLYNEMQKDYQYFCGNAANSLFDICFLHRQGYAPRS